MAGPVELAWCVLVGLRIGVRVSGWFGRLFFAWYFRPEDPDSASALDFPDFPCTQIIVGQGRCAASGIAAKTVWRLVHLARRLCCRFP